MLTSSEILAAYRRRVHAKTGKDSAYRAAKELGAPHNAINNWDKGHTISPKYAVKIGVFCEIDSRYLVACLEAERARDPITRGFWEALAADYRPEDDALARFAKGMPAQPGEPGLSTGEMLLSPQPAAA